MKMKPATPLPFARPLEVCEAENTPSLMLSQPAAYFVKASQLDVACVVLMPAFEHYAGREAQKRAAYISHTVNAYPKLVEALRAMLERAPMAQVASKDACALLRELGEM